MKTIKRFFIILCLLSLSALSGFAQVRIWYVGYPVSTDVTATLDNGTLTISGTGEMENFTAQLSVPWVKGSNEYAVSNDGTAKKTVKKSNLYF